MDNWKSVDNPPKKLGRYIICEKRGWVGEAEYIPADRAWWRWGSLMNPVYWTEFPESKKGE